MKKYHLGLAALLLTFPLQLLAASFDAGDEYPFPSGLDSSGNVVGTEDEKVGNVNRKLMIKALKEANELMISTSGANMIMFGAAKSAMSELIRKYEALLERIKLQNKLTGEVDEKFPKSTNKRKGTGAPNTGKNAAQENEDVKQTLHDVWRQAVGDLGKNENKETGTVQQLSEMLKDPDVARALLGDDAVPIVQNLMNSKDPKVFAENLVAFNKVLANPIAGGGGGAGGDCNISAAGLANDFLTDCNIPERGSEPGMKAAFASAIVQFDVGDETDHNDYVIGDASMGADADLSKKALPIAGVSTVNQYANWKILRRMAKNAQIANKVMQKISNNVSRGDGNCQGQQKADTMLKQVGRKGISGSATCMSNEMVCQDLRVAMEIMSARHEASEPSKGARAESERARMGEFRSALEGLCKGSEGSAGVKKGGGAVIDAELDYPLFRNKTFLALVNSQAFWNKPLPPVGQRFFDKMDKMFADAWARHDALQKQAIMIAAARTEQYRIAYEDKQRRVALAQLAQQEGYTYTEKPVTMADLFKFSGIDTKAGELVFLADMQPPENMYGDKLYEAPVSTLSLKAIPVAFVMPKEDVKIAKADDVFQLIVP